MSQVKSTYNFVPAPTEEQVFKPSWADQVSHDIPFSDGESGEIEIEITAETPIFIRNGHAKKTETNEFSHLKKLDKNGKEIVEARKYFIPATSLKGTIRSVFEILSSSRMDRIDRQRHAVRQIIKNVDDVIDEGYTIHNDKKNIYCGYLILKNNEYYIHECGKPLKIRFNDLDSKLGTKYSNHFGAKEESNISKIFANRTAKYKYEHKDLFLGKDDDYKFENHPLEGEKERSWVSEFQPLKYVQFSEEKHSESFYGRIINVGQATYYKVNTSRRGEYVFPGKKSEILGKSESIQIKDHQIEDFLFINRDKKSDELEDWKYWKSKISEGIPVFFRKKDNNQIIDFGLSFTYKQPVKFDSKQMNPVYKKDKNVNYGADMTECLFGKIGEDFNLKGRLSFSHSWASEFKCLTKEISMVLGNPKSSFTPFYISQNGSNGLTKSFNTYNTGGTLKGFKRYPVRVETLEQKIDSTKEKIISKIVPLDKESKFLGKIRFHNLKPIEIGALLSAITLHQNEDVFHQLGGAKPLGFGRVKIQIGKTSELEKTNEEYLKLFENVMRLNNRNWEKSYKELILMSKLQSAKFDQSNLDYESLSRFQEIKKKGEYLDYYSEIIPDKHKISLLNSIDDHEEFQNDLEKKRIKILGDIKNNQINKTEIYAYLCLKNDKILTDDIQSAIFETELKNEEKVIFEKLLTVFDVNLFIEFKQKFPLSEKIQIIEELISKKKAASGMSSRLQQLTDSKTFFKEAKTWINKLSGKTLTGSGFESEVEMKIISLGNEDIVTKSSNLAYWANGKYIKEVISWYSEAKANEIWNKIKS